MTVSANVHRWVDRWWNGEAGATGAVAHALLAPAEWAYRGATTARNAAFERGWLEQRRSSIPVISVGNISAGGSGKTPFAAWLGARVRARGRRPAIAIRGYGADEVELHREMNPEIPVFVAKYRYEAVRRAAEAQCDCAIVDDGFQHRRLRRDLDIVLVAAERWTPRPRLLPRGPWRETPRALERADLVVVVCKTDEQAAHRASSALAQMLPRTPVVQCAIEPCGLEPLHAGVGAPLDLDCRRVLAVASLADPRPFAEHLRRMGAQVELAAFRDHHPFTPSDSNNLLKLSGDRPLVMTGKDAVKLRALVPPDTPAFVLRQQVRITAGKDILDGAVTQILKP